MLQSDVFLFNKPSLAEHKVVATVGNSQQFHVVAWVTHKIKLMQLTNSKNKKPAVG